MTGPEGSRAAVTTLLEQIDRIHRRITERAVFSHQPVRAYRADVVDVKAVRRLVRAAAQTPVTQSPPPWAFAVVQDRALLRTYAEQAAQTPSSGVARGEDVFHGAGTLVLICSRRPGQGDADCWRAAENLMLAAHSMGLGTCAVTAALPLLGTAPIKDELQIPAGFSVVAAIVVGVPSARPALGIRQVPEILTWKRPDTPTAVKAGPRKAPLPFRSAGSERSAG